MTITYKLNIKGHPIESRGSLTVDETVEAAYNPAAWILFNKWPTLSNLIDMDKVYPCADARRNDGNVFMVKYPEKSDIATCAIIIPDGSLETLGKEIMWYSKWFSCLPVVEDNFYRRKEYALKFCRQIAQALDAGCIEDITRFVASLFDEAQIKTDTGILPQLPTALNDGDIMFWLDDCVIVYDDSTKGFYGYPCSYEDEVVFGDKFQVTFNN